MKIDVKNKNDLRELLENLYEGDVLIIEDADGIESMVFASDTKEFIYHLTDYGMTHGSLEYMYTWLVQNQAISLGCYGIHELKITIQRD